MTEKLRSETNKILFLMATSELAHSFLYVTYTIFLISRGVSLYQVALLCMICSLTMIVLDIPTGAFADVVGRKRTYIISCIVWLACSAVYVLSNNFWGYALAEILAALAMSFSSGCLSAHLWDTVSMVGTEHGLCEAEVEESNKALSAKAIWVTSPVSAVGGYIGAKLFVLNPSIPWIGTGVGMIFVIVLAAFVLHETKERKKVSFVRDVGEMTKNTTKAFQILATEKGLQRITITRTAYQMAMIPLFLYWSAYLKEVGSSVTVLGVAWILMEVAMSFGVYVTRKLPAHVRSDQVIYTGILLVGVSAVIGAITQSFIPVLIAILVIEAATMALGYVFGNMVQAEITMLGYGEAGGEKNMRATLLSSVSTSVTVGAMLGEFTYGYSATSLGISKTWLISGLLVTLLAVLVFLFSRQRRLTTTPQTEGAA